MVAFSRAKRKFWLKRLRPEELTCHDQLHTCPPGPESAECLQRELRPMFGGENPVNCWYKWGWHEHLYDLSILMTLGLIRLSSVQEPGSFGVCLAFVRL